MLEKLKAKYVTLCDSLETLAQKAVNDGRALTAEEKAESDKLTVEISGLEETIAVAEASAKKQAELKKPEHQAYRPPAEVREAVPENGGFQSLGEFLNAIRFQPGDDRLRNFATSDAGILIPPAFSDSILSLDPEEEVVMPRATVIPAGDPPDGEFSIPYLQQGLDGALGGVSLTWTGEEQIKPDTGEPEIKSLTLKPNEVSGTMTVTNKTLQNWQAAGAFLQNLMRQAFISGRDYKFLRGLGRGCPLGLLEAPGAIAVARTAANTIQFADIANMRGRLLPGATQGAVWLANISALPTIVQLADGQGRLIYMPGNVTQGIPDTLLGIPVVWTGKQPDLGSKGDLILTNFRYYLIKPGSGPFVALSEHVEFRSNKTVFRLVANIDGQPWVNEPLKLEDRKTTVSPYIILR